LKCIRVCVACASLSFIIVRMKHSSVALLAFALASAACASKTEPDARVECAECVETGHAKFVSAQATQVTFSWDGEVVSTSEAGAEEAIASQALFTVGTLNAYGSVGRLERLTTSARIVTPLADGSFAVRYHAELPVAWNKNETQPPSFLFTLPRRGSSEGIQAFAAAYGGSCAEAEGHSVDAGSMFYFYRPELPTCLPLPEDVVLARATIAPSSENTTGKYPEYQRVWSDDVLKAVVVFGKYEEAGTNNSDPGILGFELFIDSTRAKLATLAVGGTVTTNPSLLPSNLGSLLSEVTLTADLPYGKHAEVHVLLVSHLSKVDAAWDAKYAALTPDADLIIYNGHAGLGWNVRSLLAKGAWNPAQYLMLFVNGCDTFAYVDGRLRKARAALNPDDESGSKYLDLITNAMPSLANAYESETVLLDSLLDYQKPQTYASILSSIDDFQVAVVVGEEDNTFTPGMQVGTQTPPPPSTAPDAGVKRDAGTLPPAPPSSATAGPSVDVAPSGCSCQQASQSHSGAPLFQTFGLAAALALMGRRKPRAGR
jgi:hypothetical protein